MKKNLFMGSMLTLAAMVCFLFIACQKEQQNTVSTDSAAASEATNIVAVNGSINGLITQSAADEMRNAFLKTAGPNESQYIQFSIKDLQAYLKAMVSKYGADKVYVNFGVYDANTVPNGNQSYIGRKTVFFTVNSKKSSIGGGNIVLNDTGDSGGDSNSFNHGQIFP